MEPNYSIDPDVDTYGTMVAKAAAANDGDLRAELDAWLERVNGNADRASMAAVAVWVIDREFLRRGKRVTLPLTGAAVDIWGRLRDDGLRCFSGNPEGLAALDDATVVAALGRSADWLNLFAEWAGKAAAEVVAFRAELDRRGRADGIELNEFARRLAE